MLPCFVLVWASLLATSIPSDGRTILKGKTCMPGRGEVLVRSPSETVDMASGEANSGDEAKSKFGIFESPNWSRQTDLEPRCVYRFIADVGEKVHVKFDRFQLRGEMPYCADDFLDVYVDVASSSLDQDRENAVITHLVSGEPHTTTPFSAAIYSTVLDRSALLGRFCESALAGASLEFISLHREIVLDYYNADSEVGTGKTSSRNSLFGFNGTFEFIRDAAYYPGRVLSPTEMTIPGPISTMPACRFRIDAATMGAEDLSPREFGELPGLTGELISPTYPGFHPDGLTCAYQLIGRPTQRINVDVLDLDLPEHSATCTVDYLYFYDAEKADPEAPSIGPKFCGRNRRLRIVSTGPSLLILFVTGSLLGSRAERARLSDVPNGPFKRRGFRLRYTFTDKLLAVHPNHRMWHIRGTECDYLVRSQGSSEAKFESPTYKTDQALLPGRSCSFYFLGGLYDQHMEVVRIGFDELDLPPASNTTNSDQEKSDRTPSSLTASCNLGHLAVYGIRSLNGLYQLTEPVQNWTDHFGHIDAAPDHVWCGSTDRLNNLRIGSNLDQAPIVGQHSLVLLRLNATGAALPGLRASFRVIYRFDRAFGVPGAPVSTDMCHFLYSPSSTPFSVLATSDSVSKRPGDTSEALAHPSGWTNSPFYPNPYPSNSTCLYLFIPSQMGPRRERMRFSFGTFETQSGRRTSTDLTAQIMPFSLCDQDFLEVVELHIPVTQALFDALVALAARVSSMLLGPTSWIRQWQNIDEELRIRLSLSQPSVVVEPIAVYCGTRIPGPFLSHPGATAILLRFHGTRNTNAKGFTLHYQFVEPGKIQSTSGHARSVCGGNFSSPDHSGLIETPAYPGPYADNVDCTWNLVGRMKDSQLQLHFQFFHLEGDAEDCSRAIVRIYEGSHFRPSFEICGNQTKLPPLVLSTSAASVRFHTTENRAKASGFRLIWTELLPVSTDGKCDGFRCEHTKNCVSRNLECDGLANCGAFVSDGDLVPDNSDETSHCMKAIAYNFLHIGVGVLLTLALLLGLVGFIYYRERKRRLKMPSDPLAELTGSKHSLASTHPSSQKSHRHQCPNAHKAHQQSQPQVHHRRHHHQHHSSTLHIQSRSHHNSRTDVASTGKGTLTRTGSLSLNAGCAGVGSLSKRQLTTSVNTNLSSSAASPLSPPSLPLSNTAHHHHHHHHTANAHAHESRLTQTMPHDCASRHQLVPVHEFHRTQPPTSSRLQRRLPRQPPGYGITLSRNGGTLTGSIHSGLVGTGSSGMSVDADGGLLIREKMQKISIV